MHTSPADSPGAGDAGGMNVVELHQACALAALGHQVELVTRRSDPGQPDVEGIAPGVTLRHLDAGPREPLAKSAIDAHIGEFGAGLARLPRPDLVQSHHWMSGVAALDAAASWGVEYLASSSSRDVEMLATHSTRVRFSSSTSHLPTSAHCHGQPSPSPS